MPKTENLDLDLTTDATTTFLDWRIKINGEGSGENKSNMQKIDDFAGEILSLIPGLESYNITILSAEWNNAEAPFENTIVVSGISDDDIPIVSLNLESVVYSEIENLENEWDKIYRVTSGDNSLTFFSKEVLTLDIAVKVQVMN
jgi:hypothetical protein